MHEPPMFTSFASGNPAGKELLNGHAEPRTKGKPEGGKNYGA